MSLETEHLRGHIGHSTTSEQSAFDDFKSRCAADGLLTETINTGKVEDNVVDGICDDGTLLRFLRARGFNAQDAYRQYSAMRRWRETNQLIATYDSIDINDYEETRNLYTHWTGRRDKHGNPVLLFDIGQLTASTMAIYTKSCASGPPLPEQATKGSGAESTSMLRLCCTYDHLTRFLLPLVSMIPGRPNPETPITQTTCIVDISGMGLFQFWSLRTHLQAASTLATAYYPETLGRTYVIGTPAFFPTVWNWIKGRFDPNTVDKIFIVPKSEVLSTLSTMIDPVDIPCKYGGSFDFEFGMLPVLDTEVRKMLTWSASVSEEPGFPIGPMRWTTGEDGVRTAIAVGKTGREQRRMDIASFRK